MSIRNKITDYGTYVASLSEQEKAELDRMLAEADIPATLTYTAAEIKLAQSHPSPT